MKKEDHKKNLVSADHQLIQGSFKLSKHHIDRIESKRVPTS